MLSYVTTNQGKVREARAYLDGVEAAYRNAGDGAVVAHLQEIEGRGRYQ